MPFKGTISTIADLHRSLTGQLNVSGSVIKVVKKSLTGTLGPFNGSVSSQVVDLHDVSGTLDSFSGTVSTTVAYTKKLSGSIGFTGNESKKVSKGLAGSLNFSGNTTSTAGEIFLKSLAGFFGFSGALNIVHTEGEPVSRRSIERLGLHI